MLVRPMAAPDLEAAGGIADASPEAAAWSRAALEALLREPATGSVWVAEHEGEVVGFILFRVVDKEAELLNLAVHPQWRRRRVASRLMEQVLEQVIRLGAERIFLEVRESNGAALRLYRRYGFVESGRRPGYYANPSEDAVLLSRSLHPAD